jgi:hypothetical protein
MPILTREMKQVLDEQRLGFVATVGPDGTPNLSPKGTTPPGVRIDIAKAVQVNAEGGRSGCLQRIVDVDGMLSLPAPATTLILRAVQARRGRWLERSGHVSAQ